MVFEKTIGQVVEENYLYARALHYLGVDFFDAQDQMLKEVCKERKLDRDRVIKAFYTFDTCHRLSFGELERYPLELLIAYLKHAHHVFIKEKLPFIVYLVKKWTKKEGLKALLQEFVEDFIQHIYEEEDSTFRYIELLCKVRKGCQRAPVNLLVGFSDFSLIDEYAEHQEEDEFGAIRALALAIDQEDLHDRVLIQEIKAFDREMVYHASIENQIFFPKAMQLEKVVHREIKTLSTLN